MNVKELIEKYKELENSSFDIAAIVVCQLVLKDLEQLDEPKKVAVPQCVHKYIQEAKEYNWDLQDLMKYIDDEDSKDLQRWFYHECNQETLARAWLDGYEVEEEKRYRVKLKNTKALFCYLAHSNHEDYWSLTCSKMNGFNTTHTRKELEEAGFSEVLNSPLFEVEEVE